MARKRRSNIELCIAHKKERTALYQSRSKLIREQKKGGLSAKKLEQSNKKIKMLSARIDKYGAKIFKCGKRYAKLKSVRTSLIRKINRLKNELKANRDMSKADRNKILSAITAINSDVRDISTIMRMDIVEQKSGTLSFIIDEGLMETYEDVPVWQVKDKVEGLVNGGDFAFLVIGGETFSLDINAVSALWAVDDYIAEITSSQRDSNVTTPTVQITTSLITKTIIIK